MRLQDKQIAMTGGAGFLAENVVQRLHERGCRNVVVPRLT